MSVCIGNTDMYLCLNACLVLCWHHMHQDTNIFWGNGCLAGYHIWRWGDLDSGSAPVWLAESFPQCLVQLQRRKQKISQQLFCPGMEPFFGELGSDIAPHGRNFRQIKEPLERDAVCRSAPCGWWIRFHCVSSSYGEAGESGIELAVSVLILLTPELQVAPRGEPESPDANWIFTGTRHSCVHGSSSPGTRCLNITMHYRWVLLYPKMFKSKLVSVQSILNITSQFLLCF